MNDQTTLAGEVARAFRDHGITAALTALMDYQDQGALPQAWVLELSSFQLETTETLNATAATVLNISDDHLDRYIDLDDYALTKTRIFHGDGAQVLNRDDTRVRRMAIPGRKLISCGTDASGSRGITNSAPRRMSDRSSAVWKSRSASSRQPTYSEMKNCMSSRNQASRCRQAQKKASRPSNHQGRRKCQPPPRR